MVSFSMDSPVLKDDGATTTTILVVDDGYDLHDSPVWQRETPKAGRPCHPGAVETEPVSVLTIDTFQPVGLIESSSVVPAPHFTLGRIDSSGGNGAEGRKKDEL